VIRSEAPLDDHTLPHVRISLFGNCNFRCTYCPPWGENSYEIAGKLSTEMLLEVIAELARQGFNVVKFTGGEPTLRKDLLDIVRRTAQLFVETRLITNAWNLRDLAGDLGAAALDSVEVSIDAIEPEVFDRVTKTKGMLPRVIEGIDAARQAEIGIQLNTVVIRETASQVERLLDFIEDRGNISLKLLELVYYEFPGHDFWRENYIPITDVLPLLEARAHHQQWLRPPGSFGTPMRLFELDGGSSVIVKDGTIGAVYADVCQDCPLFPCQDGLYGLTVTIEGLLKICKHRPDLHMSLRDARQDINHGTINKAVSCAVQRYESAYYQEQAWDPDELARREPDRVLVPTEGLLRWYRTPDDIPQSRLPIIPSDTDGVS